jgi:hypothetical protein
MLTIDYKNPGGSQMRNREFQFCFLSFITVIMGCSEILDIPDNPVLVGDEDTDGAIEEETNKEELAEEDPWRCLENPPRLSEPTEPSATVRVVACDFHSGCNEGVSGITAHLCDRRDIECQNPLDSNIIGKTDGLLEFKVPTMEEGFDGFLKIIPPTELCTDEKVFGEISPGLCEVLTDCDPSAPDDGCQFPTYAPAHLFFNPPVVVDLEEPLTLPLFNVVESVHRLELAGIEQESETGNLFLTALDCNGKPAEGVSFEINQQNRSAIKVYEIAGMITRTAYETDSSGMGGFMSVPPGFAEVSAYNKDLQLIGKVLLLSASWVTTFSFIYPTQ